MINKGRIQGQELGEQGKKVHRLFLSEIRVVRVNVCESSASLGQDPGQVRTPK